MCVPTLETTRLSYVINTLLLAKQTAQRSSTGSGSPVSSHAGGGGGGGSNGANHILLCGTAGCGKTSLGEAIMGAMPSDAHTTLRLALNGATTSGGLQVRT